MRYLSFVLTLVLAPALTAGMPLLGDRDEGLVEALEEIRTRYPEAWQRLEAALGENPARARWRLGRHARYARQRAETEVDDPAAFALMVQQEAMEQEVRELVERARLADDRGAEQETIVAELRGRLMEWFEIRQLLRARGIESFAQRFELQRARVEESEADPSASRETWIMRITEGGPDAMAARLEELADPDDLDALTPALMRSIARRDPAARRMLWRLARDDRGTLREHLERIAQEHPELVAEARQRRAEALALHTQLRNAAYAAYETLLPHTLPDGTLDVPRRDRVEVDRAIDDLVEADLTVARHNLERAARELDRKRRWVDERALNKGTIVDLQLARLLEESERYEW